MIEPFESIKSCIDMEELKMYIDACTERIIELNNLSIQETKNKIIVEKI